MSLFPSSPAPQYPLKTKPIYKTAITGFETGKEFRKQLWSFPKRELSLEYGPLSQAEIDTLYDFFTSSNGAFGSFTFVWIFQGSITNEYVGRGDGTKTIFDLPSKSTDSVSLVVSVNGTPTAITFGSGTGLDGRDRVTFATAPVSGSTVTMDGTGLLALNMRFKEDSMEKDMFRYKLYNVGLSLVEIK